MQEVIKFELSGASAIIKKPESNEQYYTYSFPHKIMLLGMLGSIIGLNGYNYNAISQKIKELPEFYTYLKELKIAVLPNYFQNRITKKIQKFNNSVGYANDDCNLIVKEQWLENPSWFVYVANDNPFYDKIKEYLVNNKCEYIPYIGKNEHFATIQKVEVMTAEKVEGAITYVDSIFDTAIKEGESAAFRLVPGFFYTEDVEYEYNEILPTALNADIGYTEFKNFMYTNKKMKIKENKNVYLVENKHIYFF